jgi:hypothetical protein
MNTDAQVLCLSTEILVRAQHQIFLIYVINQLHLVTIFAPLLPDGSHRSSLLELRSHLAIVLIFPPGDDRHPESVQDAPFIRASQPAHPGET